MRELDRVGQRLGGWVRELDRDGQRWGRWISVIVDLVRISAIHAWR